MSSVSKWGVVIVLFLVLGFLLTFSGSRRPSGNAPAANVKPAAPASASQPPPLALPTAPKPLPSVVEEPLFAESPVAVAIVTDQARVKRIFESALPPGSNQSAIPSAAAAFSLRPGSALNFDRVAVRVPEWGVDFDVVKDGKAQDAQHFWYDYNVGQPGKVPAFLEVLGYRGGKATLLWRERMEAKP